MEKKGTVTKAIKDAAKGMAGTVTAAAASVKSAPEKKTEETKASDKITEAAKAPEKKEAVETKASDIKTLEESKVLEKKEAAETKAEEVKAPVKKASAKKPAAKKADTKKAEIVQEIYVQYGGQEVLAKDILEKAKAAYVAQGHRVSSIKSIRVYMKPEEGMAYCVINDKPAGCVSLF